MLSMMLHLLEILLGRSMLTNWIAGLPGLIAEFKKASPSKGILREDFDPVHDKREMDRVLEIDMMTGRWIVSLR